MQEKEARERRKAGYSRNEEPSSSESRDESNQRHYGKRGSKEVLPPPQIQSRLEVLRMQRSEALEKFRLSQNAFNGAKTGGMPPMMRQAAEPIKRDRDRLKNYSVSHGYGRTPQMQVQMQMQMQGRDRVRRNPMFDSYSEESSEIELKYTTSDSNASDTPSQKARDLRAQVEEAMKTSKEIQRSQDQLGNELNTFKERYYRNSFATRV